MIQFDSYLIEVGDDWRVFRLRSSTRMNVKELQFFENYPQVVTSNSVPRVPLIQLHMPIRPHRLEDENLLFFREREGE
jgi:hypothetical protein